MEFTRWFNASLIGAAAIVLLTFIMLGKAPQTMSWMPDGFFSPILAFEYLQNDNEANLFFANNQADLEGMRTAIWLDLPFLISYGLFLSLCCVACFKLTRQPLILVGVVLACSGSILDFFENQLLLEIIDAQQAGVPFNDYAQLTALVRAKFASLSLATLIMCPTMLHFGKRGKTFIVFAVTNVAAALIAFISPAYFAEINLYATTICWVTLMLIAMRSNRYAIHKSAQTNSVAAQ